MSKLQKNYGLEEGAACFLRAFERKRKILTSKCPERCFLKEGVGTIGLEPTTPTLSK